MVWLIGLLTISVRAIHAETADQAARQGLWIANVSSPNFISEISSDQLGHSGIPKRALNTGPSNAGTLGAIAFDTIGNLWIPFCSDADPEHGVVAAFSPSALTKIAHNHFRGVTVAAELRNSSITCPRALAFDSLGNLWISNGWTPTAAASFVRYKSSGLLSANAQPESVVTWNSELAYQTGPAKFDAQGNLWVTDLTDVFEFTAEQLSSTGDAQPHLTIHSTFQRPADLVSDGAGNLWVAYASGPPDPNPSVVTPGALLRYSASDLVGTGTITPTPGVVLQGPGGVCSPLDACKATGVAMDAAGNLWVQSDILILKYSPEQQQVSGSPIATVTLASNAVKGPGSRSLNFGFGHLVFGPDIK